jgi:hypothetical protein
MPPKYDAAYGPQLALLAHTGTTRKFSDVAFDNDYRTEWNPKRLRSGSLLILSLYNILICLVAAVLYVAVNKLEPNHRHASALKTMIIALAIVAVLAHLMQ